VVRTGAPEPAPPDEADPPAEPADPFLAAVVARGLEPCDGRPIEVGGVPYPYVWRSARVVAAPKGLPIRTARLFADKGIMVVPYDPTTPAARETIDALADALGEAE
jgi:hypothetical protein